MAETVQPIKETPRATRPPVAWKIDVVEKETTMTVIFPTVDLTPKENEDKQA